MTDADYITIKFVVQRYEDVARRYLPDAGRVDREDIDRARQALERTKNKPQENSLKPQQAAMF